MAVTEFQRRICRLIAAHRLRSGESYVAGGAALTTLTASPRISRDIDLFHDSEQAVALTWEADRRLLERHGYVLTPRRQLPAFIEADVAPAGERVTLQWARDSAYRFVPLVEHEDFGLTLHPVALALNGCGASSKKRQGRRAQPRTCWSSTTSASTARTIRLTSTPCLPVVPVRCPRVPFLSGRRATAPPRAHHVTSPPPSRCCRWPRPC